MEAREIKRDDDVTHGPEQLAAIEADIESALQHPSSSKCLLPIVLPQTSKSFRGTYFSPFVRAYVPELANLGIDVNTFVAFIDGLNEAFIAHPALEAINVVASVVSILGYVEAVSLAAGGVALGAVAASKASSHFRTKAYLKAINENLFHTVGLHATIMKTDEMMSEIGCESMNLPPLETEASLDKEQLANDKQANAVDSDMQPEKPHPDDPRMRRVRALEGYVMPLDFDVPAGVSPDTLLKRMSDGQAKRLARKQEQKLVKNRAKGAEKHQQMLEKAEGKKLEVVQKIAKLERRQRRDNEELMSLRMEVPSDNIISGSAHKYKVQRAERALGSLERQISAEQHKLETDRGKYQDRAKQALQKPEKKEQKIARKIRWVVISSWTGENVSDDRSDSSITIGVDSE